MPDPLREALERIANPAARPCNKRFDAASGELWCSACCQSDPPRCPREPPTAREIAREALAAVPEPQYEYRAIEEDGFPTGTIPTRARAEDMARRIGGYAQRRVKPGEWERVD